MTNAEYEKLCGTYGEEDTRRMIEALDNYKGATGRKYKLNDAENLSFNDEETPVEDLKLTENVRECFGEGAFDDKNVIGRVKLF